MLYVVYTNQVAIRVWMCSLEFEIFSGTYINHNLIKFMAYVLVAQTIADISCTLIANMHLWAEVTAVAGQRT